MGGRLRGPPGSRCGSITCCRGSPAEVLALYAWILVDIVLWGFITRYLNTRGVARDGFVPMLLGAVLLWDFFTGSCTA